MKKILITGATGFIGTHLVEKNLKIGNKITILARHGNPKAKKYESKGINIVYGDIRDYKSVEKAVSGVDIVFHLASLVSDWGTMKLFKEINIKGTRNICKASLKYNISRFVEVSTNDVFGQKKNVIINETFDYVYWNEPYPDTKIEALKITWEYHKKGLPVTMVYPCWGFGPGDTTFVPLIADAIKKEQWLFWKKNVIIWTVYIDNLIDLLMVISEHPKAVGEGFLIHDGEPIIFQKFSKKIAESINAKVPKTHIPYWSAYTIAWIMELIWKIMKKKKRPLLTTYTVKNLALKLNFSIKKAESLLGWTPIVKFQDGFDKTMELLKKTDPSQWKQK